MLLGVDVEGDLRRLMLLSLKVLVEDAELSFINDRLLFFDEDIDLLLIWITTIPTDRFPLTFRLLHHLLDYLLLLLLRDALLRVVLLKLVDLVGLHLLLLQVMVLLMLLRMLLRMLLVLLLLLVRVEVVWLLLLHLILILLL